MPVSISICQLKASLWHVAHHKVRRTPGDLPECNEQADYRDGRYENPSEGIAKVPNKQWLGKPTYLEMLEEGDSGYDCDPDWDAVFEKNV